jgi:hypothetical protein
MKNENLICLWSVNVLFIFGTSVAFFVLTPSQIVSASVDGRTTGPNTSDSNQGATEVNPCIMDPKRCKQPSNSGQSQGGSQDQNGTPNPSDSSGGASNSNQQQAINHINQAQSSLQNGDTGGAQTHMDLAKQALICNPGDSARC